MRISGTLISVLSCLLICSGGVATAQDTTEEPITVFLPCDAGHWYGEPCHDETITIPNGRPIYALLVSGFHQNRNLDMFHFYNFAKCLQAKGAYVHYAWWNNLLEPYMKSPLHNDDSVPSIEGFPNHDINGFILGLDYPNKAIPAEDYQFQDDAERLLDAIRDENPDAAIILVGHSMGGDAVARLAANTDVDVALLAPIDPVGNRTCVRWNEYPIWGYRCEGWFNFTRWRATHVERLDSFWTATLFDPPRRAFGPNVKYLYHRWQQEFNPPFDYGCPGSIPACLSLKPDYEYHFIVDDNSTDDQARMMTKADSGYDVPVSRVVYKPFGNEGGRFDGHGEIVGFRGVVGKDILEILGAILNEFLNPWEWDLFNVESYPLALDAQGDWPSRDDEADPADENDPIRLRRVEHLKKWEADPNYLYKAGFEPWNPGLCMVSRDLCNVLDTIVPDTIVPENLPPVADAGPDQMVECSGPNGTKVTLYGSGSTDPDDDPLTFEWVGPFGAMTGETIYPYLPVGTNSITLTVDDGKGNTDTDTVDVTVMDSTAPSLSVSLSPDVLWPPNHKLTGIVASIQVSDTCDDSPMVELVSIMSNEADNGIGDGNTSDDIQGASYGADDREFSLRAERAGRGRSRIYTVTYGAMDASGNEADDATAEVMVLEDRGKNGKKSK